MWPCFEGRAKIQVRVRSSEVNSGGPQGLGTLERHRGAGVPSRLAQPEQGATVRTQRAGSPEAIAELVGASQRDLTSTRYVAGPGPKGTGRKAPPSAAHVLAADTPQAA